MGHLMGYLADSNDYRAQVLEIDSQLKALMLNRSWRPVADCPGIDELRLVEVTYLDFDYQRQTGQLVVAREVASEVMEIFQLIFHSGFPIAGMRLIDHFEADDEASMAANNSSAFCYRRTFRGQPSMHARGLAIDINPLQNPMTDGVRVYPPTGADFLRVREVRLLPGVITSSDPVVEAFKRFGWRWGGDWTLTEHGLVDYHHFEKIID